VRGQGIRDDVSRVISDPADQETFFRVTFLCWNVAMNRILDFMTKLLGEYPCIFSFGVSEERADGYDFERQFKRWSLSVKQVLSHAGLEAFLAEYEAIANEGAPPLWQLARIAGVLESARECFEGGFTGKLRHLLHAEMFDSVVDQAKGLLEAGHKVPAAVLLRIVIERWLRDQGDKAGVPNSDSARVSMVNDGLKTAGAFSTPKWRQIQGLLDIGNAAAHGSEAEFTEADVGRMIDFADANCV
jgi:hypothetical protein